MYQISKEPRFNTETFSVEYLPTLEVEFVYKISYTKTTFATFVAICFVVCVG